MEDLEKKDLLKRSETYWKKSLIYLVAILVVWFVVSFGCGILLRDWLDINFPKIGNAPFGFWMSQQGSIICFVLLIIAYSFIMNKLDSDFNKGGKEQD